MPTVPACPGYASAPFDKLVTNYPDETVYPRDAFRTEWGPIFHRGRLDGTAGVVVIGQDPAAHETVARRILVGEAGQRVQGFLGKLGVTSSYVFINASLYSVYDSSRAAKHLGKGEVAADRNAWLDAVVRPNVKAVVALGTIADGAWRAWTATSNGAAQSANLTYTRIMYPTADAHPDISVEELLQSWNAGLDALWGKAPNEAGVPALVHYGIRFAAGDVRPIPSADMPPGLPDWMRAIDVWARRATPPPGADGTPVDDEDARIYTRGHLLVSTPRSILV